MDTWLSLVGWLGTIAGGMRVVPQLLRLWRTRDTAGVSCAAILLFGATELAWVLYAGLLHDLPAALAAALPLPVCFATCYLLFRARALKPSRVLATAALVVALVLLSQISLSALGWLAAIGSSLWTLPQALELWRGGAPRSGVSVNSWMLVAANALIWLVYAAGSRHYLLGIPSLTTLPTATYVAWRALRVV